MNGEHEPGNARRWSLLDVASFVVPVALWCIVIGIERKWLDRWIIENPPHGRDGLERFLPFLLGAGLAVAGTIATLIHLAR